MMGKPDSPVGMVDRADPAGQKRQGFLERGLLLLLLLVTGALVALGILYSRSPVEELMHPWAQEHPQLGSRHLGAVLTSAGVVVLLECGQVHADSGSSTRVPDPQE
ncbi:hypothetical protein H920_06820 [Fukomys damarensis]|uniref:Uncharacterized protein n=1 Tax=Fukomys damarensis TaxID=885580 RepID=A0A091DI39_FUKDA|nr:hypothetical protein H920_06820 [Fukomys damarensis]